LNTGRPRVPRSEGHFPATQSGAGQANRKRNKTSKAGFGSLRRIFHTMMLIDPILPAGQKVAPESGGQTPNNTFRVLAHLAFSV
jgi:hypothetical protein